MAFRKTSIAVDTQILSPKEARRVTAGRSSAPANPSVGDEWEGKVWDGRAWVLLSVWEARQAAGN
jgi:hypothetical protein